MALEDASTRGLTFAAQKTALYKSEELEERFPLYAYYEAGVNPLLFTWSSSLLKGSQVIDNIYITPQLE